QTGSGKTGAFLLPILHRIDPTLGAVQALVLAPTRELAVQVSRDAEHLGRDVGVRALPIYGGVGYKAQLQGLDNGAQLVIGTPGRILDHLLKGNFNLDRLKILVFDEADRMLSMGFYPDMKQLQRYLPRGLQSAMFSATYPGHVKRLAQQFLKDPVFVSLSQDQVHASDVVHVVYKVPAMQKSRILVKIIEQENPSSGIIFCNTKADVHFVSVVLRRFGYDVGEISADLSQAAREEVLEKLRQNRLKFLVATDVAARGIDIHELSHVFQYQPPQDHEAYVHRTGRTGRAGAAGVAISLVSGMEEIELEQIAKKFSIALEERQIPTDEELETLISQRAVFLLEARLRKADNIQKERMQRFVRTVGELAANEESRALLAMLVDEFYQSTFHAPLEQPSEKLFEPARPQAVLESSQGQPAEGGRIDELREEEGRSEGDKRRRKRNRKKPGSSLEGQGRGEVQAEAVKPTAPAEGIPQDGSNAEVVGHLQSGPPKPLGSDLSGSSAQVQEQRLEGFPVQEVDFESDLESIWDQPESGLTEAQHTGAPKKRRRRRPRKTSGAKPEAISTGPAEAPMVSKPEPQPTIQREERKDQKTDREPQGKSKARPPRKKETESQTPAAKPKKKIFLE
ncbi:MAG: DEAD/DEAH box helicase, partial [Desulfovibrionales bacterium]|nr:DEAD/DEAH box helicase [Desulfovibrionales bacterium]